MNLPYGLTRDDLRAIRVAWALYDDARDKGDLGHAKAIREGLERKARELGLKSADDLSNI